MALTAPATAGSAAARTSRSRRPDGSGGRDDGAWTAEKGMGPSPSGARVRRGANGDRARRGPRRSAGQTPRRGACGGGARPSSQVAAGVEDDLEHVERGAVVLRALKRPTLPCASFGSMPTTRRMPSATRRVMAMRSERSPRKSWSARLGSFTSVIASHIGSKSSAVVSTRSSSTRPAFVMASMASIARRSAPPRRSCPRRRRGRTRPRGAGRPWRPSPRRATSSGARPRRGAAA